MQQGSSSNSGDSQWHSREAEHYVYPYAYSYLSYGGQPPAQYARSPPGADAPIDQRMGMGYSAGQWHTYDQQARGAGGGSYGWTGSGAEHEQYGDATGHQHAMAATALGGIYTAGPWEAQSSTIASGSQLPAASSSSTATTTALSAQDMPRSRKTKTTPTKTIRGMTGVFKVNESDADELEAKKRYPCPICERRFDRPSSLKKHRITHTGEKAFGCPIKTCERLFNVKSNLKRHLRTCHPSELANLDIAPAPAPDTPPKPRRPRRISPRARWVPASLADFKFSDIDIAFVVPAPPVIPDPARGEERNSYDTDFGRYPYSPQEWLRKPVLCGPAAVGLEHGFATSASGGIEALGSKMNRTGVVIGRIPVRKHC